MSENKINLDEFNMSEDELFSRVNHDELESEKITAPRYSYWHSVFRVFFKKKINIIVLAILAVLLIFTYVYPAVIHYDAGVDPYINLMDSAAKHLNPQQAQGFGVRDKHVVQLQTLTERPVVFEGVMVRVHPQYEAAVHLDYDEANACGLKPGDFGRILT